MLQPPLPVVAEPAVAAVALAVVLFSRVPSRPVFGRDLHAFLPALSPALV